MLDRTRNYIRLILQAHRTRRAARRWVRAQGVKAAAYCMFHLNRTAKHSAGKDAIYTLKNHLVRWLYENDYCTSVYQHEQVLECYSCGGTGRHWTGESCWKCNGTGEYARIPLYAFRFDIGGCRYSWHQPACLVDFDIELADNDTPSSPYYEKRYRAPLPIELRAIYYYTVKTYLEAQGVPDLPDIAPTWSNLRDALRYDWHKLVAGYKRRFTNSQEIPF